MNKHDQCPGCGVGEAWGCMCGTPPSDPAAITRKDGLTEAEGVVMDALCAAVTAFSQVERQHPDEMRDFVDGIHKCQDQLAVRIARRHHPEGWPTKP